MEVASCSEHDKALKKKDNKKKRKRKEREDQKRKNRACSKDQQKNDPASRGTTPNNLNGKQRPSKELREILKSAKVRNELSAAKISEVPAIKTTSKNGGRHPFETEEADHCETPWRAYQDVLPVLEKIATGLGKNLKDLKIYDPYYCDGGVQRKLNSLGCHSVINANRDFYQDIASDDVPVHDVVMTNPPYSGNHMESLLQFLCNNHIDRKSSKEVTTQSRTPLIPFLLLLPHYVYTKPFFLEYFESDARGKSSKRDMIQKKQKLFYLVPKNNYRYSYEPPSWVSHERGSTALCKGKTQTAPFPSFWYCHVPILMNDPNKATSSWLTSTFGQSGKCVSSTTSRNINLCSSSTVTLQYASCTSHLPREFKGEFDVTKKRPNPRARKRAAKNKHQQSGHRPDLQPKSINEEGSQRKKRRY